MEKKILNLVRNMPYGLTVWHAESEDPGDVRLVLANREATDQSGFDFDACVNKQVRNIFPDWKMDAFPIACVRVADTEDCMTLYDVPYGDDHHPHGWFRVTVIPMGDRHVGALYENVTVQKRLEQRLKQMAMEDQLTGVVNLRGFKKALRESLERAERSGKLVGILFCDLDGFKDVNDTFGHDTGDLALKAVANRLEKTVRKVDVVGRLGGDEFGVILESVRRERDIRPVAGKIIEAISSKPWYLGGRREANLGISIGVTTGVSPDEDMDLLIQQADAAMYKAKSAGGNRVVFAHGEPNGK